MKRRKFLSALSAVSVVPAVLDGFSIRSFGASPLLQALAASTNNDHVLVLIQLSGGNDGLNTVIPLDQYSLLSTARNNILIPSFQVLSLNGNPQTGLHPSMSGIQQLFNNGRVNIVQGVSYPSPNFSHFRATDIWLTASDHDQSLSTGWAGRYLDYEYPNYPVGYPNSTVPDPLAIEIGSSVSLGLQGPAVGMGFSITDPTNFYNLINGIQDPAPNTNYGRELTYIRLVNQQSQAYSGVITNAANNITSQSPSYPVQGLNNLSDQLKIVARLIAGGLQTKIYMVSIGGFDTHSSQADSGSPTTGNHADLLAKLSVAVSAFQDDLSYLNVDDRVIGMTFSEFGRRIISNGSLGTDHGSGAPMILFGNAVQSGILGTNPVIPSNANVNDNVAMQYDFRSVYSSVLNKWFCVPAADLNQIMLQNFQVLPVIQDSACVVGVHELNQKAGESLVWNYPNPFTSSTYVTFKSAGGHILLQVFTTEGKLIKTLADGEYAEGTYEIWYENEGHPAGTYYLRLQNESLQQVKNMIVVK
ncbi:MAG TPA: DUF1501 domain-containing protein [Bacteroidia bacterium]|nr:DUF1501 domain-containing protein [Bacteroidia bacterium]